MPSDRQCEATTREGRDCRMAPLRGGRFCFVHSPGTREEAAAARRNAGRSSARDRAAGGDVAWPESLQLDSPAAVLTVVELAVRAEVKLPNSSRRNRSVGYLLRVALTALEAGELEERMERVERLLESMNR